MPTDFLVFRREQRDTHRVMQITETGEEFWAFQGSEDACDTWIDECAAQFEESGFYVERIEHDTHN